MKGLVAEILIVVITLASTVIVVSNVGPIIDQGRRTQAFTDAKQVIKTVDSVLNEMIFEAPGSQRAININLPEGRFVFSGSEDKIKIRLIDVDILEPGVRIEEDNIIIQGGGVLSAYDNGTDYVLENNAVLVAIRKLGSPLNFTTVNTTSIISLIKNKRSDVDAVPKTGIFIEDMSNSSFGQGFSELAQSINVQSGAVRVYVNSSAAEYDALFTLAAADDFFELQINNVVLK